MAERKIELTWVCTSCQARNLGRFKACQTCGNPKDASETFEMPGDTRAAASVTDPALLAAARAGADWRCPFCRADNGALVSTCKQCGATRGTTPANAIPGIPRVPLPFAPPVATRAPRAPLSLAAAIAVFGLLGLGLTCVVGFFFFASRPAQPPDWPAYEPPPGPPPGPTVLSARVESRAWEAARIAMRRRLVPGEGFADDRPADAVDVTPDGVRHHHDDQVQDGTETQTYQEDVPYDDVETYVEMVPCGEDCTPIPQTCTEECTDDGNGFASCHDVCTGGGQSCTPRTCPETRTRTVTRTRPETRTRQVPHYRAVPVDAPWFRWRSWAWVEDRRAEHHGTSEEPTRPSDEELGAATPLGEGEEERIDTSESCTVTLRDERGGTETLVPASLDELARYPVGRTLHVEVEPWGGFVREVPDDPDSGLGSPVP